MARHGKSVTMLKKIASVAFLLDGLVIGLGGFGHGSEAATLHAAIDRFPIDPDMHSMIYVVWYFLSGCMFVFGLTLAWAWWRLRAGDRRPVFAAALIGALYLATGVLGLIYRDGDPFMGFFVALGTVNLLSLYVLTADRTSIRT